MIKISVSVIVLITGMLYAALLLSWSNPVDRNTCYFKGIRLYGRIQVVNSFPDIKVQVVTSFPDLKVLAVKSFPDHCGEWQFVNSFPDFKIQLVNSLPDIRIMYVDAFPGVK